MAVWVFVTVWIMVGLGLARLTFQKAASSETYLVAASRATTSLFLLIGLVYAIGLIFLVWLKIVSGFWFVWELMFLTSVVAVFWVGPALGIALLSWAAIGHWRLRYAPRAIATTGFALAILVIDVLLYYAIAIWMV
jgi:hypothetical protein